MTKLRCLFIIFALLLSTVIPLRQAQALIPFEISLMETAGKFGTWVQEKLAWVQLQVSSINQSKIAQRIGSGLQFVREIRTCIRAQYNGDKDTLDKYCQKYIEKYKFIADSIAYVANTKKFILEAKSDISLILQLKREIINTAAEIDDLRLEYAATREDIKEQAELDKITLEGKIKMAQEDLAIMKVAHAARWAETTVTEKAAMMAEEESLAAAITKMQTVDMAAIWAHKEDALLRADQHYGTLIAEATKRHADMLARLTQLNDNIANDVHQVREAREQKAAVDIALEAKQKYSASDDKEYMDDMGKLNQRFDSAQKDIADANLEAFNEANVNIAAAANPANDPTVDADTGSTTEGKSESLQASIDITLRQVDLIEKIVRSEIQALELETLNIIRNNVNYRLNTETKDESLLIDFCDGQDVDINQEKAKK